MKKAQKAEHETNLDHINDIRAQIKKLEDHLAVLLEATKPVQLAMAELGGTFNAKSFHNDYWKDPSLDGPRGVSSSVSEGGIDQWWEVDMPNEELFYFTDMTIQKRGDGVAEHIAIDAVRFQYSRDGQTWEWHDGGKYYKTGQKPETPKDEKLKFAIDPPITGANKIRVWLDADHANNNWFQARFDLWAKKE